MDEKNPQDPTSTTEEEVITLKKSEYEKQIQSVSSKAKNELLKEIGLNSVQEIKQKFTQADSLKALEEEKTKYQTELEQERQAKASYENELLVVKNGISPEFANEFIILVNADKSGEPKSVVAEKIKEKLIKGGMFQQANPSFGTGKQTVQEKKLSDYTKL
jgi:hypothetical protein